MTNELLVAICGIFAFAGLVKGTIGFGLPTVGIGLGALFLDIPTAMTLILGPTILTNLFQVFGTGSILNVINKTWPFLLASMILVPLGLIAVVTYPSFPFDRSLGVLIVLYSFATLRGFRWTISKDYFTIIGILSGLFNSIFTGMTGSFLVPGVMYLRAFEFSRDDLLCAMGLLFLLSTIVMGCSLITIDRETANLSYLSVLMCIPVGIGVSIGTLIRRVISEAQFTRIFLWALLVLGLYLVAFSGRYSINFGQFGY